MEEKFLFALEANRQTAEKLGVRIRPITDLQQAHRALRRGSDGFMQLEKLKRLELTLEALAIKKEHTALFSDEEVNDALSRLLDAGYFA